MDPAAFAQSFPNQKLPLELEKLLAFDQQSNDYYSDGFELCDYPPDELSNWSEEREFLSKLVPFAQANGSGSIYALWFFRDGLDPSAAPVVVFGDEGGMHVVTENLRSLLQVLAFDSEPMIDWEGVTFYKSDDHEPSKRAEEYATWLKAQFDLSPVQDADALVAAAQQAHKAAFDAWVKAFVSS